MLLDLTFVWFLCAIVVAIFGGMVKMDDGLPGVTDRADVAILTVMVLFAPLVIVGVLIYGLWRGSACLVGGFIDLYRQLRPRKRTLPTARVVR